MELFERLIYLHQDPAKIAAGFAYDMRNNPEAKRSQIPAAFASLLQARKEYKAQEDEIEREQREKPAPWEDFEGTNTKAQREAWHTRIDEEATEAAQHVKAIIAALDALFVELCRALEAEGITLTGEQITPLKRAGLPDALAEEIEAIKSEHLPSIPKAERLEDSTAAILYEELTRYGLISGSFAAFSYHLGQVIPGKPKEPREPLKWAGKLSDFAYFARCFAAFTQREIKGMPTIREKALCRAFGFDDRQRANVIHPYIRDKAKPRNSAYIDAAFAAALMSEHDAPETSTGAASTRKKP